jgi:radical SAM modification target selenobiotic family peptide
MDKQDIRKILAGLGIVSLLAGAGFNAGCSGSSSNGTKKDGSGSTQTEQPPTGS